MTERDGIFLEDLVAVSRLPVKDFSKCILKLVKTIIVVLFNVSFKFLRLNLKS